MENWFDCEMVLIATTNASEMNQLSIVTYYVCFCDN